MSPNLHYSFGSLVVKMFVQNQFWHLLHVLLEWDFHINSPKSHWCLYRAILCNLLTSILCNIISRLTYVVIVSSIANSYKWNWCGYSDILCQIFIRGTNAFMKIFWVTVSHVWLMCLWWGSMPHYHTWRWFVYDNVMSSFNCLPYTTLIREILKKKYICDYNT